MLITFEGVDSCGKKIQSQRLMKELGKEGLKCSYFSFPVYETKIGQLIKEHLHDKEIADSLDPKILATLYALNRLGKRTELKKAIDEGIVICNRYTYSNLYQAAKTKEYQAMFIDWFEELEFELFDLPKPTVVVFFDLPPELSSTLQRTKEVYPDLYERDIEFLSRVYELYKNCSSFYENWIVVKCYDGDSILPVDTITDITLKELRKYIVSRLRGESICR